MYPNILYVFLIVCCCVSVIKSGTTKAVTVLKCCKTGETLQVRKENDFSCAAGNDSSPMIYSPRIRNLLDQTPDYWTIKPSSFPDCGAFAPKILKNIGVAQSFLLVDNGKLLLFESKVHVSPTKYCYNSNMALYCSDEPVKIKVKKCCGQGAVYSETKKSCITMNVTDYKINIGEGKSLVEGFAPCDSSLLIVGKLHEADLKMNGSLEILSLRTVLPPESFCLEHVLENAGQSASIFACHDHLPSTVAPTDDDTDSGVSVSSSDVRLKLYPACLLLSAVFLAATLVAGTVLPATHHHMMHWRCQTKHVACLLVGDVVLAITQLAGNSITGPFCIIIAIVMHFSFLAAFFWLNTMCFNIWWTFRDLRPGTLEKRQETCRLRLYGVYAWGVPLVISMIALILDTLPKNPEYNFLRPRFGEKACWFPGDMEILTYFFGPIGVLLVINLLLFAATARELTCGLWKRELVKSTTERAALGRVCMKLVVVMGVTWIADVISWAAGGHQALWYITDLINAFQGVFIFIVVACQPQVWTAIKRLWCRRQSLAADITGNGNHHSSSSHGLPSFGESVTNHSVSNTTRSMPLETSC